MKKIKVLIVDDSAIVRQSLEEVLSSDPAIEVIATARDPFIAAERIKEQVPDVITLDVEMPRMDGITFLQKIMSQHPLPVVMCSSLTENNSETTFKALEYGAVEIIQKPKLGVKQFLEEGRILICDAVKAAARTRTKKTVPKPVSVQPKLTADAVILRQIGQAMAETTEKVVVVGASTGGTEALKV
jgi:two-component system, chemotaxis family, protein-glutamate methylesterase/glutaminase